MRLKRRQGDKVTAQKDRITRALAEIGAAWAATMDKCILTDDPLEDQIAGRATYHIHPDATHPHVNSIQRFDSLVELEDWIRERRPAKRRERSIGGKRRNVRLPDEWVKELRRRDGNLQAAIERLVKKELRENV